MEDIQQYMHLFFVYMYVFTIYVVTLYDVHANQVRRSVALKGNMPVRDVELKVTRGASDGETGAGLRIGDDGGASELRSVEALDRSNSRRIGDLGLR